MSRYLCGIDGCELDAVHRTVHADDPATPSERPADGEALRTALTSIAARMVRMEGGCEKGHRAGRWHMHEERFHAIGRELASLTHRPRATPADPERRNHTDRTDLCPDCGHHLHRPQACGWYDCPCPADPERRSVTVETLRDALRVVTRGTWSTPARRDPERQARQDEQWLRDTAERILAAIPQDATPAGLDVERVRRAFWLIQRWPPDRDSAEVFAEAYLAATDDAPTPTWAQKARRLAATDPEAEGIASAGGPEQSEHPE